MAYAVAAVAWDAADAVTSPISNGTLWRESGPVDVASVDSFHYRKAAVQMIDGEIVSLMQRSTLFSLATLFQDILTRYVYMRRALQGRASIDQVRQCQVNPCFRCAVVLVQLQGYNLRTLIL